ncbi:DNA polymerase III subunit beta [Bacillus paralicheniformis]|uniref:DNA polymerase III subunit beta n=1 Tax=Bacillus paralicheniformis TaxID=1648923 RepID=UPI000C75FF1F|nr:DNA polymerase III subunit beta [Bacillus paralicheniformis]MCY1628301.1 DNA polymerase III subunit beta [Bacillus paralicheniformis]PLC14215.1 DNA polymerase III subunit beta [Bacillus paralicheniformis]
MTNAVLDVDNIDVEAIDKEVENELKTTVTIAIQTETLKKAIGKVERSVSKKAVQDIFKFIFIDIKENKLTFRAINNEFLTEATVSQNEEQSNFKITSGNPGSICFPADKLVPIVKRLKAKNSEFRIESNIAVIKSGRPEFNLNGIDGSEFPNTPNLEEKEATISIHPDMLRVMYSRTIYACAANETRPILTGGHHILNGKQLKCVATDSHRLAQFAYELDNEYPDVKVTVPAPVMTEALKHLSDTEMEVQVHFYSNQIVYEFDDAKIYGRILDGNYPNTDALLFKSEQAGSSIAINAGMFKTLLNNSTVYNSDQPIIIRIKPGLNQLRANTREAEVGAFEEDLSTVNGAGEDVIIAVNVRYLQDALAHYGDEDQVKFIFSPSSPEKPVGMRPFIGMLDNGNEECLELFVPVRTNQIDYNKDVEIENFKGIPEFEFNPFEEEFKEIQ